MIPLLLLRIFTALLLFAAVGVGYAAGVTRFSRTVTVHGTAFPVTGVRVDLNDSHIKMQVGLAYARVGHTETLDGIARRYGAVAAINGSFFDAYSKATIKNPDMSLITQGKLVFKSDIGALLGFAADNTPLLGCVRYRLGGTVCAPRGKAQSWYAYWLNRRPTASECVTLFTRHWGETVEPMGGTSVVIRDGVVATISTACVKIPDDGYVLHVCGETTLLSRFSVGARVTVNPGVSQADAAWKTVHEAVGAGPRVLVDGVPLFNPSAEGFSDPKILTNHGARSAAGVTRDRILFLITTRNARVNDLGPILQALGCSDGMNLDGGASSGLWLHGAYLTRPGRAISNALLVLEKK